MIDCYSIRSGSNPEGGAISLGKLDDISHGKFGLSKVGLWCNGQHLFLSKRRNGFDSRQSRHELIDSSSEFGG